MDKGTDSAEPRSAPGPATDGRDMRPGARRRRIGEESCAGIRASYRSARRPGLRWQDGRRRTGSRKRPRAWKRPARARAVLRGARSRHQQLPAAGRRAGRARVSASSIPSRASCGSARASRRAASLASRGDGARDRRAPHLRAEARRLRPMARVAPDRDGGVPARRERRRSSSTASATSSASSSRSSTAAPRRGSRPRAASRCSTRRAEGAVLFDIGGGSSEIVWLDRRKARRRGGLMRAWVSLPVGVVTLAERHGGVEVDDAVFEAMVDDVRGGVPPLPRPRRAEGRGARAAASTISARRGR